MIAAVAHPSASFSAIMRVHLGDRPGSFATLARAIGDAGASLGAINLNAVAVVSDGTAVLGLGDIGPEAALPVMEGKAMLFKEFADVNAWPLCLATKDVDEIVATVTAIAPVFGGINLEDISAPRC